MSQEYVDDGFLLARLTAKQREVMDLLIEHKTSKEIARELGISPHTVDQRIQFVKDKLGAVSRNDAAMMYRRLNEIYEQSTYKKSGIAAQPVSAEKHLGTQGGAQPVQTLRGRSHPHQPTGEVADYRVVPELFDGRYGTLIRLGAIAALAVFLVILVLGGLAILAQLSALMSA